MIKIPLCSVKKIPNDGSNRFLFDGPNGLLNLMVIKKRNKIFIYKNICPHIGSPLDFSPGNFLDQNKEYIMCSSHGALFRISDGYCISGPCAGKKLEPLPFTIKEDQILLAFKKIF